MWGLDCWTGQLWLRSKLLFHRRRHRRQKADIKLKLDVQRLTDPEIKETLVSNQEDQLDNGHPKGKH